MICGSLQNGLLDVFRYEFGTGQMKRNIPGRSLAFLTARGW
jgi:hypothetical protein